MKMPMNINDQENKQALKHLSFQTPDFLWTRQIDNTPVKNAHGRQVLWSYTPRWAGAMELYPTAGRCYGVNAAAKEFRTGWVWSERESQSCDPRDSSGSLRRRPERTEKGCVKVWGQVVECVLEKFWKEVQLRKHVWESLVWGGRPRRALPAMWSVRF